MDNNCGHEGGLINPLNACSIPELLNTVLEAMITLGSIVLVLALVYVGFLFVFAQGNEEKLKSARSALVWTMIGGLVLLGAQAISLAIQATVEAL
jgi:heme/copper-type cytochrome/quinol oxidase subunit 2